MSNTNKGAFRSKKVYFTQVSNEALRDENISLKAKGLYAIIQSYITIEGFVLYKDTLQKVCKEGRDGFNSAWNELKKHGYLKQYRMRDEETNKFYYEYELLDIPSVDEAKTLQQKKPHTEKPYTEKPYDGKPGTYNNTDLNNTYSMYVCMYEKHLIADKNFKDFIASNEIHNKIDLDLFEHVLVKVLNNNRVKKKDSYFLKAIKEIANKGIRTISDYNSYLKAYKEAKKKTKQSSNTSQNKIAKNSYESVKTPNYRTGTRVHETFRDYEPDELERMLLESQKGKFD